MKKNNLKITNAKMDIRFDRGLTEAEFMLIVKKYSRTSWVVVNEWHEGVNHILLSNLRYKMEEPSATI